MKKILLFIAIVTLSQTGKAQYHFPAETDEHEGTWLQWPHNNLYGPFYQDDVQAGWVTMVNALQSGEKVHIIALDAAHQSQIVTELTNASVPLTNVDFYLYATDDVWVRDNGPIFVYDQFNNLTILDWGFNGWGGDTPFSNCDVVPQGVATDLGLPLIDLSAMVLEGGAIEHDGNGTMMATRSSVTHSSRNPTLTESDIENYMTTYLGITNFIWLDGVYGTEITDMHIDGFVKMANDSTIVTMNNSDLVYWQVPADDIDTIYAAKDANGDAFNFVYLPLTQNDVSTTFGNNLGYKGSYVNYYIANDVVLMPAYNDPNDAVANGILSSLYPTKTVVNVDVRNLYEYGGMVHCVTQQQPLNLTAGIDETSLRGFEITALYPNPTTDQATLEFHLDQSSLVEVQLMNAKGQWVQTIISPQQLDGSQKVTFNVDGLSSGTYICTMTVNNKWVKSQILTIK